jgi:Glycosyl transferase family 2
VDLTIILPSFTVQRLDYLIESCKSLIEQDYPFHVFCKDNGSNSYLVQNALKSLVQTINNKWGRGSIYISSKINGDSYGELLTGAITPYVLFWTDDDVMLPNNLSPKIEILKNNSNLGLCFSPVLPIDSKGNRTKKDNFDIIGDLGKENILEKAMTFESMFSTCKISMPSCIMKTSLAKKYYGSSPCRIGGEWSIYLNSLLESDCAYVAEPTVLLRLHEGSDTHMNGIVKGEFLDMHYVTWKEWIDKNYEPNASIWSDMLAVWCGLLLNQYGEKNQESINNGLRKFFSLSHLQWK